MAPPKARKEDEAKLIEAVRAEESLWKKSHPLYKNKLTKGATWERVAGIAGWAEAKGAQAIWKQLRDQYGKAKKRAKTGSGQDAKVNFVYADEMSFVDPELEDRPERRSNLDEEEEEEDEKKDLSQDMFETSETQSSFGGSGTTGTSSSNHHRRHTKYDVVTPKRGRYSLEQKVAQLLEEPEEDDAELYAKQIAKFLRRIHPAAQRPFQNAVNDLMQQFEFGTEYVVEFEHAPHTVGKHVEMQGPAKNGSIELDDEILEQ